MDQRDQELLDKQLRGLSPPRRNDGIMILMVVVVFFAGMTFGDVLFTLQSVPMRTASNDLTAAIFLPNGGTGSD
jgi:hypothetical protein